MKVDGNLIRSCEACECYGVGCEENCPFELREEGERPTLAKKRRNMKAEKAKAYAKAMRKRNSAENRAAVETSYEKPENKSIKDLEKELKQLIDVHHKKGGELFKEYPKAVFAARAEEIKQVKRELRRQKKNKK